MSSSLTPNLELALRRVARAYSYAITRNAEGHYIATSTCPACDRVDELNLTELAHDLQKELER